MPHPHGKDPGFSPRPPAMARPAPNARPDGILNPARTFFAATRTSQRRPLLQSDRNPTWPIDVLRWYVAAGKFRLHDFVLMPDHLPLSMTVGSGMTIERAMPFIASRKEAGAKAVP